MSIRPLPRFVSNLAQASKDAELKGFAHFVLILLVIGTVFYTWAEGWSLLDSFYHSAMVLTTIGAGDMVPVTPVGKLFTVAYVFVGLGSVLGFVAVFAGHIHGRANGKGEDRR